MTSPAAGGYQHPLPAPAIVDTALRQMGVRSSEVALATSYELCRRLNAAHGRTYYFATRFLPANRRHHVHALYGFARYADDLVDHGDLGWSPGQRRAALERWSDRFLADLAAGRSDDPVCRAVVHTVTELGIDHDDLRAFLRSMAMDLTVTRYPTYEDLHHYVYGSAAVIGAMMLPVLGADPRAARQPAMDLGVAFQLSNFLRDIGEDYARGRIYLPLEDLDRFHVTEWDFHGRRVGDRMRELLRFEIARARELYRRAEAGWSLLPKASGTSIRIAHHLYAGILDEIERMDCQVFRRRARVSGRRKAWVAARELMRASRPGTGSP
jgi:phytoene synthase